MGKRFLTLLINPPLPGAVSNKEYRLPPALLYLAAYAQNAGESVEILDMNIYKPWKTDAENPEDACYAILHKKISETKPGLVGLGCFYSGNFPAVLKFSKFIKDKFSRIRTVTGGMHPTIFSKDILLNCASIDYIILGEGEEQLLSLIWSLKNGRADLEKIDNGFAFRKDGKIAISPKRKHIEDLDEIPFPAYDLVDFKEYENDLSHWHNPKKLHFRMTAPLLISRSCPYRCNFCSMFQVMGPRFRSRSAKNVVDEIELLRDKYGINHFNIIDDNFTFDKRRTIKMCMEIRRRNISIQFETLNGVMLSRLDKDIIGAMAEAGWVRSALTIESGSDYIRNDVMGKNLPRKRIYDCVAAIRTHRFIFLKACFIIGMPEETLESLEDTYDMIKELDIDEALVSNLVPYPGTRVFDQCRRDNLLVDIDLNALWKESALYHGMDNKKFFVKPYRLEMKDLQDFRKRIDELCASKGKRL